MLAQQLDPVTPTKVHTILLQGILESFIAVNNCGGTCDVWPAVGVWAGWEHTGSAGGSGTDCEQVPAIRSNQGLCIYVPALFVVGEPGSRERERKRAQITER